MLIIPSILVRTSQELKNQIQSINKSVSRVQIDLADGIFVDNKTVSDPKTITKYCKIEAELHLMVNDPLKELKKWQKVKQIKKILVHFESVKNLHDILSTLHAYNWEIGIVLNPETNIKTLDEYISEIKGVMFMGVHPGKQGQKLLPKVLNNIKKFKTKYPKIFVELDGGVNEKNLEKIIISGVDAICPGSAIFGNKNKPADNIKNMNKFINSLTKK
ncbi:MAG: hypothetical protein COY69_00775 [Candidatus Magasanikbacteria bacterium CG_4_10_14_0_8_um_filter_32_14]|uniref:Ribulose-phosphate 3-epimerase n=2 Tax=Candidatus Magasanikiibacteriota TaxID=1752731 RepID=A0A2M7RA35_9BACT|nr:MAG: hypothetical protein AUJ23_00565 [Candidatus Magasanikbacteria bacterium CG1_02_32_51]PIY93610.1 MAG: hypothetical protein COY69_00775 [Candidatus Magasanikbacteria bacterium CG_4_10_14_0_8_um_filter_32_14]